jgi:hypothetical protein
MSIFQKFGNAFHSFWSKLWGADADKVLAIVEANSPLVKAAKPVVADLQELVPDTKVAVDVARDQVKTLLTHHLSIADANIWLEEHVGLTVSQLLAAAARRIIASTPIGKTSAASSINLAIELALQLIRA